VSCFHVSSSASDPPAFDLVSYVADGHALWPLKDYSLELIGTHQSTLIG
jgi:hypothetical protein